MKATEKSGSHFGHLFLIVFVIIFLLSFGHVFSREGIGFPAPTWGIGFGNLKNFTGLRFNLADRDIGTINGINITGWKAKESHISGTVNGFSLGLMPMAETLRGIQVGILGTGAEREMAGINLGLLGAGCGGSIAGINVGGLGIGCGGNMTGINIGGLGVGCGGNLTGLNIGGLGVGSGANLEGINIGGLGVGCGANMTGLNLAGLGVGAGNELSGVTFAGLGAGAPRFYGLAAAGIGLGGHELTGVFVTPGTIRVVEDGTFRGLAISGFNHIQGTQRGLAIGIVNYAYRLKGVQIGLINIVRDNPAGRRVLPIININF